MHGKLARVLRESRSALTMALQLRENLDSTLRVNHSHDEQGGAAGAWACISSAIQPRLRVLDLSNRPKSELLLPCHAEKARSRVR